LSEEKDISENKKKRHGILGGAFDPIHCGHLALAHAAIRQLSLAQVIFIPTYRSPLATSEKNRTPAWLRMEMVRQAIASDSAFMVSDLECKREGISYTVDTLRELKQQASESDEFFFLVGSDWTNRLDEWKDLQTILSLCTIVVATRPGFQMPVGVPNGVQIFSFDAIDLSSSDIRRKLSQGEAVDELVPKPVMQLINQHRLYQRS